MRLNAASSFLAPAIILAALTLPAQTTTPPPGNVPVTSQTAAPGERNPETSTPETKKEKKEEKKEKKKDREEKKSKRQVQKEKKDAKKRADSSLPPA